MVTKVVNSAESQVTGGAYMVEKEKKGGVREAEDIAMYLYFHYSEYI